MRIRHTAVVVLTVIAASLFGLTVAVVAFGQSTDPTSDYTVPLGDYTQTTPATPTTPTPTLPSAGDEVPSSGHKTPSSPSRSRGTVPHRTITPSVPAKTTRQVNTLAFTGAEPLLIGLGGVSLMLLGFALHHRRRRAGRSQA